ncbi:MAG: hypothetical protein ACXVGD_22590 [Blastococcus sp.]
MNTRPRSWPGKKLGRVNDFDSVPVSPTRSASSRVSADPVCDTTPRPPTLTDCDDL